jgi:predicted ribonuclease YlaK
MSKMIIPAAKMAIIAIIETGSVGQGNHVIIAHTACLEKTLTKKVHNKMLVKRNSKILKL